VISDAATVLLLERVLAELQGLRTDVAAFAPAPARAMLSPDASNSEELLDVKSAAAYCRVSLTTIYRASERGQLPCLHAGSRVRFARPQLDAWLRGERPEPGRILTIKQRG
jgi:excisionase family DNA binding protein